MTGPDAARLREALIAARDVTAARGVGLPRGLSPVRPRTSTDRRLQAAVVAGLAKVGFDVAQWESELAKSGSVARHGLEDIKADAIRQSGAHAEELRAGVKGQRKVLDLLGDITVPPGNITSPVKYEQVVLDSPFLIWPTSGLRVDDSTIEPWKSRAKTIVDEQILGSGPYLEDVGTEKLHFYFLWENPSDGYALVTVDAFLLLNGFCLAFAPGGFFRGAAVTLNLDANLDLLGLPTAPLPQDGQSLPAVRFMVDKTDWFSRGRGDHAAVFRAFDLLYEWLPVPTTGVVIDVNLSIHYDLAPGEAMADFSSGEFNVSCPFVQLAIVTS